jgi:aminoglycoside phosphotransferase (APT) family kinase protein
MSMHADEVPLDDSTVRGLIDAQFPQWRGLPVARVESAGTDHAIYRLGTAMTVRMPLRRKDPATVRATLIAEGRALGEFADVCPVPAPRPLAIGEPGLGYPMPFSVTTWVPGSTLGVGDRADSDDLADDLASLIAVLRAAPVAGRRFSGNGRGGVLADHDSWMSDCVRLNGPWLDPAVTGAMWARLRALPRVDDDVMSHKDLIPGNVIVTDGRLAGVLDGGGFGPADPALDLVCAWHLLDARRRARFRTALRVPDLDWDRGRAWAFQQAMGLVHYYAPTNHAMHHLGLRTMQQLMGSATRDEGGPP